MPGVELEPGGRFVHVAISYQNGWLHVHPRRGVEWRKSLPKLGFLSEILHNSQVPDPNPEVVAKWLGLPYDFQFRWEATDSSYCSKLVAQLLNIAPSPMEFDENIWGKDTADQARGKLGISPDEVFRALLKRGYRGGQCRQLGFVTY